MSLFRAGTALLISAALLAPAALANAATGSTTHHTSSAHRLSHGKHRYRRARGQQAIQADRVTEIQQALIREHYLSGDPNGEWDSTTVAAMQKYQADHGWQTKLTPDSRALKSLGLGPDYSTALNANGSSFAAPNSAGSEAPASAPASGPQSISRPAPNNSGFIAASGVSQ